MLSSAEHRANHWILFATRSVGRSRRSRIFPAREQSGLIFWFHGDPAADPSAIKNVELCDRTVAADFFESKLVHSIEPSRL